MKEYQIVLGIFIIGILLFVLILLLHIRDDNKKINKAMRVLNIPIKYKHEIKHLLLSIYKNHSYMLDLSDEAFRQEIRMHNHQLLKMITSKLDRLVKLEELILEDKEDLHHLTVAEIVNKFGVI